MNAETGLHLSDCCAKEKIRRLEGEQVDDDEQEDPDSCLPRDAGLAAAFGCFVFASIIHF